MAVRQFRWRIWLRQPPSTAGETVGAESAPGRWRGIFGPGSRPCDGERLGRIDLPWPRQSFERPFLYPTLLPFRAAAAQTISSFKYHGHLARSVPLAISA